MKTAIKSFQEMGNVLDLKGTSIPTKKKQSLRLVPKTKSIPRKNITNDASNCIGGTFHGVVIQVPGKSTTMNYEPAKAGESEHWHHKNGLGGPVFLHMNFFKVTQVNLATKIVATVTVKKAIDSEGNEVTVLDISHTPREDGNCQFTYHIFLDGRGEIEIDSRVANRLHFEPRKNNRLRP